MRADRAVTLAAEGKGFTLGELRVFIEEMDDAGAADSTPIGARVTFGGLLKELKATAVRFGDTEPAQSRP